MNSATSAVPPGEWLGLLGGGQLGRMFCMAAQSLGFRVCVLDPDEASPAGAVADRHFRADYLDDAALEWLALRCKGVTTEFENVPAAALERLAGQTFVSPAAAAVGVAQDRALEKRFLASHGLPVVPHAVIQVIDDLARAGPELFPGILKSARLGYDGKGQARVGAVDEAREAWVGLGRVTCVLEKRLPLLREVSVVVCRSVDGHVVTFPVAENEHREGILAASIVPARIAAPLAEHARRLAIQIAEAMHYVGVLCVEFFVIAGATAGEALVVNELAPRPHNSGHWSIDGAVTCQFEQQARILARLPLGSTAQLAPAVMLNLLGDLWLRGGEHREPAWSEVLADPLARLHLYGKREARPGRKMGHLTLLGASLEQALEAAHRAAAVLGLPPVR
jgi:5-(carboxyamino)imidazole ribonucleotide synthase